MWPGSGVQSRHLGWQILTINIKLDHLVLNKHTQIIYITNEIIDIHSDKSESPVPLFKNNVSNSN